MSSIKNRRDESKAAHESANVVKIACEFDTLPPRNGESGPGMDCIKLWREDIGWENDKARQLIGPRQAHDIVAYLKGKDGAEFLAELERLAKLYKPSQPRAQSNGRRLGL